MEEEEEEGDWKVIGRSSVGTGPYEPSADLRNSCGIGVVGEDVVVECGV